MGQTLPSVNPAVAAIFLQLLTGRIVKSVSSGATEMEREMVPGMAPEETAAKGSSGLRWGVARRARRLRAPHVSRQSFER